MASDMIAARTTSGQFSRVDSRNAWIGNWSAKMTVLVTATIFQRGGPWSALSGRVNHVSRPVTWAKRSLSTISSSLASHRARSSECSQLRRVSASAKR